MLIAVVLLQHLLSLIGILDLLPDFELLLTLTMQHLLQVVPVLLLLVLRRQVLLLHQVRVAVDLHLEVAVRLVDSFFVRLVLLEQLDAVFLKHLILLLLLT